MKRKIFDVGIGGFSLHLPSSDGRSQRRSAIHQSQGDYTAVITGVGIESSLSGGNVYNLGKEDGNDRSLGDVGPGFDFDQQWWECELIHADERTRR